MYGLWPMHSHWVQALCDFLYIHYATGRVNLYRGCGEIVQKSCKAIVVALQSLQIQHGNSMVLMQAPYRGCEEMVRWLCQGCTIVLRAYDHNTILFGPNDHLNSCLFCKISMWAPHNAPSTCLQAYYFVKFVIWVLTKQNRRSYGTR